MHATIHKLLLHGQELFEHFLIPICQLAEDAQEARHKEVKFYTEHNTRKMARELTNKDLFNILLVSSDPVISIIRPLPVRQGRIFTKDLIMLLDSPEISSDDENDCE